MGVGKLLSRLAFQFLSTLQKDWTLVTPAWSKDTKVSFFYAAKRTKIYLGDTEMAYREDMMVAQS